MTVHAPMVVVPQQLPPCVRAVPPAVVDPELHAARKWLLLKEQQPALAGALAILLRGLPADWPRREFGVTRPDAVLTIRPLYTAPYDFPPEISPYRVTGDIENCPACEEAGDLCRWHAGYAAAEGEWFSRLLAAMKADPNARVSAVLDQHVAEQEEACGCGSCTAQAAATAPADVPAVAAAGADTPDAPGGDR